MEKVCLNAVTCILCPLYGRTCDGKPEHPLDVQDIPTTEEEDVLLELRFERDCMLVLAYILKSPGVFRGFHRRCAYA